MHYSKISDFSLDFPQLSFWQSPLWKNILIHSSQAKEVFYYGSTDGTFLLIEIRSIGIGQFGAFSLGVTASQIQNDYSVFLDSLVTYLGGIGVLFFQIEPLDISIPLITRCPVYKTFITPHTQEISLLPSIDQILSQMHEKGRYNIRLAEKRGIEVKRVVFSEENVFTWINLLRETTNRDGFSGNSNEYYRQFLIQLDDNHGGLYFAYYGDRVIAAGIFVFYNKRAIYYYGASSSDKDMRKHMAPYLLQWTAICDARSHGCEVYDFLGVADPLDPRDPLRGVTEFKEKFGGTKISLPQKICIPLSWKFLLFRFLRLMSGR